MDDALNLLDDSITTASAADLLPIAIAARTDQAARWEFTLTPKIETIILREVFKRVRHFHDREDAISETRIGVVEALAAEHLEFASEGELVAYWNQKVRGLVEAAIRRGGNTRFVDGRPIERESPAGAPEDLERKVPNLGRLAELARSREETARNLERLAIIRKFLVEYPDQVAVNCFIKRVAGRNARALAEALDLACVDEARAAYHRVYSDLIGHLLEQGEQPAIGVLAAHVEIGCISAVVRRGGRLIESWTVRTEDLSGFRRVTRALGRSLAGVGQVVVNRIELCDEEVTLRHACWARGLQPEVLDEVRTPSDQAIQARLGIRSRGQITQGEKLALALALAKEEENRARAEMS